MLFKSGDCVKGELVVCCDLDGGTGDDHGSKCFVGAEEVFDNGTGNGDEMCFEIVRVTDDEIGGNNVCEGLCREVASSESALARQEPWIR